MPSYVPPKKNTQYILYVGLASQSNPLVCQSNPTIAAGDFKVSIDGGALANLTTLPTVTPSSSKMVKITLSTSEMNGDNITVVCSDASGAEWCDLIINIQTSVQQVDDLASQASVNTIDDYVDTEIASISASIATLLAASVVRGGQAQAGAAGTITLDASASATDDLYNGHIIVLTSSTGAGQARLITDYVGSTKVASVSPNWTTNPSATSIFHIIPAAYLQAVMSITTGAITSASFASGAINAAAIAADAIGASELAADAITEIQNGLATAAALTTIDDFLDTEIAAILAAVDTEVALILASTVTRSATAQAGAAGTITLDASASATDDFYNGQYILITSSTGAGQVRLITDYVGSTKVATISPNWATNPSATSVFSILPSGYVQGLVEVLTGAITSNSFATGAINNTAIAANAIGASELDTTAVTEIQTGLALAADLATVSTAVDAIKAKTDNLPTDPADESSIQAAIAALNDITVADVLAGIVEGTLDVAEVLRIILAAVAGKSTGGGTTSVAFRDQADTKNRIDATVDGDGNRTAITLDPS